MSFHFVTINHFLFGPDLTVAHGLVVVSVRQQHVVQSPLQARLRSALEEDVVGEGPVQV